MSELQSWYDHILCDTDETLLEQRERLARSVLNDKEWQRREKLKKPDKKQTNKQIEMF